MSVKKVFEDFQKSVIMETNIIRREGIHIFNIDIDFRVNRHLVEFSFTNEEGISFKHLRSYDRRLYSFIYTFI